MKYKLYNKLQLKNKQQSENEYITLFKILITYNYVYLIKWKNLLMNSSAPLTIINK